MAKTNDKIAVVIHNYIQCLNVLPGIEELIKQGYHVDIYGLLTMDDTGFQDLFNDVIKQLRKKGYHVYNETKDINYKILLEPYESSLVINAKYRIRYRYSQITAKPNKVYLPLLYMRYDCILCSGKYAARLLNNYTNTEIVGDLKYINFKKKDYKKGKKVLLYLPTYGKESSIELIVDELKRLREEYYVIAKIHHGTCFLKNEIGRIDEVAKNVDESYDLHKELKDLLEISDVVLTDNSASVFDAIYNNVPVAVFTNDINQNKLGDFNTIQYELNKEGILPYTNDPKKISTILKEALSDNVVKKQNEWNKNNFEHSKDPLKDFVRIIEKYLKDDIDIQSFHLRRQLHEDFLELYNNNGKLKQQLESEIEKHNKEVEELKNNNVEVEKKYSEIHSEYERLKEINNNLEAELKDYRKGKLYKVATKLYKIKNGGKKRKKI